MKMILKKLFPLFFLAVFAIPCFSQKKPKDSKMEIPISSTTADARKAGFESRESCESNSLVAAVPFRCIGPSVMGGRVVDVEVDPKNSEHFYVAYATGGLWVTYNNGSTLTPLFQDEMVMTIGDIAVDWNHNETIWIGTGESNSSRSSYSGFGIYKGKPYESWKDFDPAATNALKPKIEEHWTNVGLNDAHHIGRIILHPTDPNIAWVAVVGHLYSQNDCRGIYKTLDAGKSWMKVLDTGKIAGAIDLTIDPLNPNELYCAIWEKERKPWNFKESGELSGIYSSLDAGTTWTIISKKASGLENGFPIGPKVGRIGLAIYNGPKGKWLYAIIDNQEKRKADNSNKEEKEEGLKKEVFISMSKDDFAALDNSQLNKFLKKNHFPKEHSAESIKLLVEKGTLKPSALYDFLFDANEDLFNVPVIGAEVYSFNFENQTWSKTHKNYLDDFVYSYGYYFGMIRVDPSDPMKIYIGGVPLLKSDDGGAHFKSINPRNVHGDHHALWIDPKKSGHLINGSDGGVQISYDDGKTFTNCNTPEVGQFYSVAVDNAKPYNVYGGLQDNGVWSGPSHYTPNRDWYFSGDYPFKELMGGDGMQVQVDSRDNTTVYTGYQFGYYARVERGGNEFHSIHPSHTLGEIPLRWNWQSPIWLSSHQEDIFYICSQKVHRSLDKGESFEAVSNDLTAGDKNGNVPYGTITGFSESPVKFGWLAAGSDDGLVHVSTDNGYTWKDCTEGLPPHLWVSRIIFSAFNEKRIYVTLNAYRFDQFNPYIFVSDDLGNTWKSISSNLPMEPVNVIREDPRNENVLYVGTDNGLYATISQGKDWMSFGDLPSVPVHDIAIQKRELDIVVGTHGRSIWIGDIESMAILDSVSTYEIVLLPLKDIVYNPDWGSTYYAWSDSIKGAARMEYFSKNEGEKIDVEILTADSTRLSFQTIISKNRGINHFDCNLELSKEAAGSLAVALNENIKNDEKQMEIAKAKDGKYYLPMGTYILQLTAESGKSSQRVFHIIEE